MTLPIVADRLYALLQEVTEVMERYPELSDQLQTVLAPEGMRLNPGEILIQVVDSSRNVLELHPCKITEIAPGDTDHATQVVAPLTCEGGEPEYIYYTETVAGHKTHSHANHYPN